MGIPRWVPASAADAFRTEADKLLNGWALKWGLAQVQSTVEVVVRAPVGGFRAPWQSIHSNGHAWLQGHEGLEASLRRQLFGQEGEGGVADEVAALAAGALVAVLKSFAPGDGLDEPVEADDRLPGHWGIRYVVGLGDCQVSLAVGNVSLARSGWIKMQALPRLERRALDSALAKVPVSLTVELGACEVSLSDIAGLSAGDLVLSAVPSHLPMRAVCDGGHLVVAGLLGRLEGSRALQLSSLNS